MLTFKTQPVIIILYVAAYIEFLDNTYLRQKNI